MRIRAMLPSTVSVMYPLVCLVVFSQAVTAETWFEADFEGDTAFITQRSPEWSLQGTFSRNYGTGNHFEVTSDAAHSGRNSLRFSYDARNGLCNTCGLRPATQHAAHDGSAYFVDAEGRDLTRITDDRGHQTTAARPGRFVFNRSRGFSKWRIKAVADEHARNDRLDLELVADSIDGSEPRFDAGNKTLIARECGVDGIIGRTKGGYDLDRRSDCNAVISWFKDVPPQPPGSSIFRRMYLKADIGDGPIHTKLNYFNGGHRRDRSHNSIVLLAHRSRNGELELHAKGFRKLGKGVRQLYKPGRGLPAGAIFEPGRWYYIEQQFHSESAPGKADGEYRLWFSPAGEESPEPVLELTGLAFTGLGKGLDRNKISFWGNTQHNTDSHGAWYIDDVRISDRFNGPAGGLSPSP